LYLFKDLGERFVQLIVSVDVAVAEFFNVF
jgi:hypothetical protein